VAHRENGGSKNIKARLKERIIKKMTFERIKCKVLDIIDANKYKEVDRKTDVKKSGIYMLYVDCFDDEKIIPFYIGQTSNFQERYKQHFCELLSLNRLDYSCYKHALLKGLYNGHYRACKIFSYMVNHKCEIKDLHMIIIEEIDNEKERIEKETEYINALLASFVGLNQMNCVSKYMDFSYGICKEAEFKEIVSLDFKNLQEYSRYGYNVFNWYLASGHFNANQKECFLSNKINNEYVMILENKKRLEDIKNEISKIKNYNCFESEKHVWRICKTDIAEYFSKCGLRSEEKQKLVIRVLLFGFDDDKKTLFKYFEQYKNRCSGNIIDLLNEKYQDLLEPIRNKVLENQKKYRELESEEQLVSEKVFYLLLPTNTYKSHPLKSAYEKYQFCETDVVNNICYINIEYTCFKADYDSDSYPRICKIDYYIKKDDLVYSREVFIKNELNRFWETDEIYYYESGFRSGPFNICLVGNIDTYIPVSMEYKNGINEYTLKDVDMEDEIKVFKEIDSLIDEKTKIVYTTSGYKSTIKRYSEIAEKKNISVLKRIIRSCR